MDGIIDSLIGFLPVIFAVLWILRLISRRKDKLKKAKPKQAEPAERMEQVEQELDRELVKASPGPMSVLMPEPKPKPKMVQPAVQTRRLVKDIISPDTAIELTGSRVSALDSIKELSPLAQGMVWSVILDKPLSLKEPEL